VAEVMAMSRPELLAFDVNQTLLDLTPLHTRIEGVVGAPADEWFTKTLHASLVANEIGAYRSFDSIGVEALVELAGRRGLSLSDATAAEVVETMTRLPVKLGVYNALERLFDAGFAMIALTNGSTPTANAQIEHAGLHPFMQRVISVEEVGLFKPAAEVYVHAAQAMHTPIRSVMMVAAHDWDCAGAIACGARAALVKRPRTEWVLPTPPPEVAVHDMTALAELLTKVPVV
jgi:2-haloacid dehalogenase